MAVELDPQLLEILACPSPDHAPLRLGTAEDKDADFLTCTSCGRSFPVRDGIPVLLLDEAVMPAGSPPEEATETGGEADA
ncbi:MAG TPA: Trm112 family protein [Pseudonocardiaceae bacterium]|nr:Trm112 family protein [Pseudonocardiaceae bacterium]